MLVALIVTVAPPPPPPVDAASNSYRTSSGGTSTTYTRFIDTPANGFLFSKSTASEGVTMVNSSGWSVAMIKGSGTEFDGWATYVIKIFLISTIFTRASEVHIS